MIENYDSVDVFVGVDVGKGEHHAVALNTAGKVLFDKPLPNEEAKMRAVLQKLKPSGTVLVVVDPPTTIGALPIDVAQAENVLVGFLPSLAMQRIADLHAGEAKTDGRDAAIIAQAARTLPHALQSIQLADESVAELSMLCGFDDDSLGQMTATSNRFRGLLGADAPSVGAGRGPASRPPRDARSAAALPVAGGDESSRHDPACDPTRQTGSENGPPRGGYCPGAQRADRCGGRHQRRRDRPAAPAAPAGTARRPPPTTVGHRRRGREPGGRPPTFPRPDEHARSRRPDCGPAPHRSDGQALRDRWPPRRLRRSRTRHEAIRARRRCDVLFAILRDGTLYETKHALAA